MTRNTAPAGVRNRARLFAPAVTGATARTSSAGADMRKHQPLGVPASWADSAMLASTMATSGESSRSAARSRFQ